MKQFISASILIFIVIFSVAHALNRHSNSYLRDRVLLLYSPVGTCSAVQVVAPSKAVYTMSAGHCRVLADEEGMIMASDEHDTKYKLHVIQEDPNSDLLLLTAPNSKYVILAKDVYSHELIHTMTHGGGFPSYRTDGEVLENRLVNIPLFPIEDIEDEQKCSRYPKQSVEPMMFSDEKLCFLRVYELHTDAFVLPGSSGGAVVNAKNELVGIVSASYGNDISALVMLSDIKRFLADK